MVMLNITSYVYKDTRQDVHFDIILCEKEKLKLLFACGLRHDFVALK